jgi:hypothetical protein
MSCGDEMRTLLSRYVDGELGDLERAKAEDHLLSCEACRELLALFQKNENLVASALSTDAFGDAVIESVVRKISLKGPPEARPVEEGAVEWIRSRPWIPAAAAAMFVIALVLVLNSSRAGEVASLKTELKKGDARIEALAERDRKAASENQQLLRMSVVLQKELDQLRGDTLVKNAIAPSSDRSLIGYVEPEQHLVVKASFAGKGFIGFNVFRKLETEKDDPAWKRLNSDLLQTPEFVDQSAKPGQSYVYKFEAIRQTGERLESVPLIMGIPFAGNLTPENSVWIHCMELSAPNDLAIFILERVVNGKKVMAKFYTEPGKTVGGKVKVDGVEIDFTTDLELARIVPGTEVLRTHYTTPLLDKDGSPVMLQLASNVFIPAVKSYDFNLGQRESKRAVLRLAGTTGANSEADLWKGSRMVVRTHGG